MGITGTDVSKEAADMILLDDNFATIVKAIREGRRIYDNIKKFILYVLSCNLGEILTLFFAPVIGLAIPLLPIHILWINLVTDGLPGLALVAERAERGIMNHPPRHPKENLFAGRLIPKILITGCIMAGAAVFIQWWTASRDYPVSVQRTAVFTLLCFIQLGNALSVRSMYHSLFSRELLTNRGMWGAILLTVVLQLIIVYVPALQSIFKTSSLNAEVMKMILWFTLAGILCIESLKLVFRPKYHQVETAIRSEKQG
jgi:Ca2+-transporting ATPase